MFIFMLSGTQRRMWGLLNLHVYAGVFLFLCTHSLAKWGSGTVCVTMKMILSCTGKANSDSTGVHNLTRLLSIPRTRFRGPEQATSCRSRPRLSL